MNRSRFVWGLYDFRHTRHINVVKWYSNMHAHITSIRMHVVVLLNGTLPRVVIGDKLVYSWAHVDIHDHLDRQQDWLPWRILPLVRVIVV